MTTSTSRNIIIRKIMLLLGKRCVTLKWSASCLLVSGCQTNSLFFRQDCTERTEIVEFFHKFPVKNGSRSSWMHCYWSSRQNRFGKPICSAGITHWMELYCSWCHNAECIAVSTPYSGCKIIDRQIFDSHSTNIALTLYRRDVHLAIQRHNLKQYLVVDHTAKCTFVMIVTLQSFHTSF